jgi:hypothetical protein
VTAYRTPLLIDPEVSNLLRAHRLATSPDAIESRSAETPAIVERLCARSWHPLRRLFGWTYRRWVRYTPSFVDIPKSARGAARELGFTPLAWVVHGAPPSIETPNFIGPDGFIKLEVFDERRLYLYTNFDDGTAVSTSPGFGGNIRTTYLRGTDDLRADYLAHLAEVGRQMKERGCQPLYRSTLDALVACYRLFPAYQVPVRGIPLLLLPLAVVLFVILALAGMIFF